MATERGCRRKQGCEYQRRQRQVTKAIYSENTATNGYKLSSFATIYPELPPTPQSNHSRKRVKSIIHRFQNKKILGKLDLFLTLKHHLRIYNDFHNQPIENKKEGTVSVTNVVAPVWQKFVWAYRS
ncbi:unnamed protein product [Hermetia illucens]|uniref:Uncharacterized protein n=1 Tax=Hermetia illucens TaxID=343691 RepID=A0A7R8UW00_HERIL|nr:unnamed protein product [Hermetia illucens]